MGKYGKDKDVMMDSRVVHMATGEDVAFSTQELPFIDIAKCYVFRIGITLTAPESDQVNIDNDDVVFNDGWSLNIYLGPIFISIVCLGRSKWPYR